MAQDNGLPRRVKHHDLTLSERVMLVMLIERELEHIGEENSVACATLRTLHNKIAHWDVEYPS